MRISVIIPSYERRDFLAHALESVFAQTEAPTEVIVVDDGSSDGTDEMVATRFPEARVVRLPENLGVSAARNAGIEAANEEWLAFLDSDDRWLPDKLAKQRAVIESSGLKICHTDETWIRDGQKRKPPERYKKSAGRMYRACLPVCAIGPSTAIIHRSIFDDVGLFDEGLIVCEDYDLWLRITCRYEVALVDEALIEKYGGHEDQLSNRPELDRYRILALEHLLAEDLLDAGDRSATLDELISKIRVYADGCEKHDNPEAAALFRSKIDRWTETGTEQNLD